MTLEQCPRRYDIEPRPLFSMRTGVGGSTGVNAFRCVTPDPRVWVKFGVVWVPKDGTTAPSAATQTLWIAAIERTGIANQGRELPVEDLIGTSAAPLAIPVNAALYGKFVNVQQGHTGLQGALTITTPAAGVEGVWYCKATYFPTVDMAREEWDKLIGVIGGIASDDVVNLSV